MKSKKVFVPSGEYYLGDIGYAVNENHWTELGDSCNWYETPIGKINGYEVVAFKVNSGTYYDQHGNTYHCDSGLIGLIHVVNANLCEPMRKIVFKKPTWCCELNGVLFFDDCVIKVIKPD